ncbi:hypothetical protein ACSQ6I_21345 [Anabaena sp. WFMT]
MRRRILFEAEAFEEFNEWAKIDCKLYNKIVELIIDTDIIINDFFFRPW